MPERNSRPPRNSAAARRARGRALVIFYITAFAAVMIGAVLLCVFVFFRVSDVELVGETDYLESDIRSVLGINEGDNLVLLTTGDRESTIEYRFPYIEDAEIIKHIPSTVEVRLTAATTAYSVQSGSRYIYVSEKGKVLELADWPAAGSTLVTGGTSDVEHPSQYFSFTEEELSTAFARIRTEIEKSSLENVTAIDLSSLYDVTLTVDDRLVLELGNTNGVDYKIAFAVEMLHKMEESGELTETTAGVVDLSVVPEQNKAFFREEIVSAASGDEEGNSSGDAGDDSTGDEPDGDTDAE